jgi:hypothetical protein
MRPLLGLFAVGRQADSYLQRIGDDQRDYILKELDDIFDGAARVLIKNTSFTTGMKNPSFTEPT